MFGSFENHPNGNFNEIVLSCAWNIQKVMIMNTWQTGKLPTNEKKKPSISWSLVFLLILFLSKRENKDGSPYLNSHLFRNVDFHHRSYFITLITLCGYGCCCDYLTTFCKLFKYASCIKASYRFHRQKKS